MQASGAVGGDEGLGVSGVASLEFAEEVLGPLRFYHERAQENDKVSKTNGKEIFEGFRSGTVFLTPLIFSLPPSHLFPSSTPQSSYPPQ